MERSFTRTLLQRYVLPDARAGQEPRATSNGEWSSGATNLSEVLQVLQRSFIVCFCCCGHLLLLTNVMPTKAPTPRVPPTELKNILVVKPAFDRIKISCNTRTLSAGQKQLIENVPGCMQQPKAAQNRNPATFSSRGTTDTPKPTQCPPRLPPPLVALALDQGILTPSSASRPLTNRLQSLVPPSSAWSQISLAPRRHKNLYLAPTPTSELDGELHQPWGMSTGDPSAGVTIRVVTSEPIERAESAGRDRTGGKLTKYKACILLARWAHLAFETRGR